MTIIDVARELEKDGTKRFRRALFESSCYVFFRVDEDGYISDSCLDDLLATDWEEVKE